MKTLIILFSFLIYLPNSKSDCFIKYTSKGEISPKFEKSIGKFKIKLASRGNDIRMKNGESVNAFCATQFSPIEYSEKETIHRIDDYYFDSQPSYNKVKKLLSNRTNIVLNCVDNELFYNKIKLDKQTFSCSTYNWNIYSTKQPYDWCRKNKNSDTFLFATENLDGKNHVLAAFCYNIDQLTLLTLVYNKTNVQNFSFSKPAEVNTTKVKTSDEILDEKLWNFSTTITSELSKIFYSNELLQDTLDRMAQTEEWLRLANYEVSSILQDSALMQYFKGYDSILNIIWWRPLRLGNWKQFQDTLTNYAQNNSYELYVGTSGVAQYPIAKKCYKEKFLEIQVGFKNETVPAYIWSYLKSNDQVNKDFVIVGYNSPYAEYFTTEKIIFCPDICKEIPWLKNITETFGYAYAGIMFCCSTDFIRQTNYLQGFPLDLLPKKNVITTDVAMDSLENFTTELTFEANVV